MLNWKTQKLDRINILIDPTSALLFSTNSYTIVLNHLKIISLIISNKWAQLIFNTINNNDWKHEYLFTVNCQREIIKNHAKSLSQHKSMNWKWHSMSGLFVWQYITGMEHVFWSISALFFWGSLNEFCTEDSYKSVYT